VIIEKGVEMIGLCENLKKVLPIIETAYARTSNDMIITATKWGRDPLRWAHEAGRALDVHGPSRYLQETVSGLSNALGLNYTVRIFKNHLHIEYTPLGLLGETHLKQKRHYESMSPVREARRRGII